MFFEWAVGVPAYVKLLLLATWLSQVHAGDGLIVHGWVREPDGRGTWSILWSSLVTIFICTWSALHLNVPGRRQGGWLSRPLVRKSKWMLLAITAPEWMLWISAHDYRQARKTLQYLAAKQLQQQGQHEWTMTHMLFACAHGFRIRTREGRESECTIDQLRARIVNGDIEGPPISGEELEDRGKADWVVKLLAIVQISWFLIQTLVRATQHYHITALELLTVAFVFCSIFIYGFSFRKPKDVEFPVYIEIHDHPQAVNPFTSKHDLGARPYHATPLHDEADEAGTPLHDLVEQRERNPTEEAEENVEEKSTRKHLRLLTLLGCIFGAIHCLAWNASFPTSSERLAWRICSVVTTAIPVLITIALQFIHLVIIFMSIFCNAGEFMANWMMPIQHLVLLVYAFGRITIIILAFIGLRALPADAFQTVDWTRYFPHFSS